MKIDTMLSEKAIKAELHRVAPPDFDWDDLTVSELVKFQIIAEAQCKLTLTLVREKLGTMAFLLDEDVDSEY